MTAGPKERGTAVSEGGGCLSAKCQPSGPHCLGGCVGSPSGDGVGGCGVERCPVSKAGGVFVKNVERGW